MKRRETADPCAKQEKHEAMHSEKDVILAVFRLFSLLFEVRVTKQ